MSPTEKMLINFYIKDGGGEKKRETFVAPFPGKQDFLPPDQKKRGFSLKVFLFHQFWSPGVKRQQTRSQVLVGKAAHFAGLTTGLSSFKCAC